MRPSASANCLMPWTSAGGGEGDKRVHGIGSGVDAELDKAQTTWEIGELLGGSEIGEDLRVFGAAGGDHGENFARRFPALILELKAVAGGDFELRGGFDAYLAGVRNAFKIGAVVGAAAGADLGQAVAFGAGDHGGFEMNLAGFCDLADDVEEADGGNGLAFVLRGKLPKQGFLKGRLFGAVIKRVVIRGHSLGN